MLCLSIVAGFVAMVYAMIKYASNSKRINISEKTVLITGGASGIGRSMARKLASLKCTLILLDIDESGLKKIQEELNSVTKCYTYLCDVSDKSNVAKVIQEAKLQVKFIDIVINNAGIVSGQPLLELSQKQVERTFKVNAHSHFWMAQSVLPDMIRENKGCIVTISSVMGTMGAAGLSDYCSSKWAVNGFHESLRLELMRKGADGIHTLLVCPYAIDTGMFKGIFENSTLTKLFMPILKEQVVVDAIIQAVVDQKSILIGCADGFMKYVYPWAAILMHMLPPRIMDMVAGKLGASHGMDTFEGK